MPAPIFTIDVEQNATFKFALQITDPTFIPIDITGWIISGTIKTDYSSPTYSDAFNIQVLPSSTLSIYLLPEQTAILTGSSYVYDILAFNPTVDPPEMYRLLQGGVRVDPGVTIDYGTD